MKIRIPHPTHRDSGGCVPHLPAPGCWPAPTAPTRPCFPPLDLLTEVLGDRSRDAGRRRDEPGAGHVAPARRRPA